MSALDCEGANDLGNVDTHCDDGKRFIVHADEILTAFVTLESAIRTASVRSSLLYDT